MWKMVVKLGVYLSGAVFISDCYKLTFQLMAEVLISRCAFLIMLNLAADTTYGCLLFRCQQLVQVYYLRRRRRLCFWFGLFVCLSVCLSVRRITRELVNGF